ncbi:Gldg family protein [Wenyingzhuangia sp. 2_MG-2023]|uniref:Gldg family protein n=1 Tax=Wenyingzhuangia sp. 2_MG-2023 TaxID=3062639 RepID=UPI0026E3A7A3|nr:Gldg family protein [Wenyingzhuangia sp. 2_MG-2023]MDO6736378.1 Gldg family protein [Wenyingzhuangia sp. 2_MG-2023]
MKKIVRIARVELSILFYSPVAWLVLIIFIIQCGITITDLIDAKAASQELGNKLKGLTKDVFGGYDAFFNSVKNKLYLYIPLLTMGLMSRELSSGSIKLLLSSPITNRQIILGKFLAMLMYCFLLVLVLFGVVLIGVVSIESIDFYYLLGGVFGLYLLACSYAAIGLFMSSLTTYQVVAAMSTLAVFALLNFMSSVGQSIDFVRDITYWMSLSDRVDNFRIGLISSKDVIYFLLIISLFLTLSIMRLNAGRSSYSSATKAIRYSVVVASVLFIGYLSSLSVFNGYYDTTRFKTNTLTKNSQELFKQLDAPLKITVYPNVINYFSHIGAPKFRIFDLRQFEDYTRFLPNLEINYQPYYNYTLDKRDETGKPLLERAQRYATANGYDFDEVLNPEEIDKIVDLSPELNGFVRVVEYKGKTANLRMFFDQVGYPKEAEVSAAIKNILHGAPKVGVLTGNYERGIAKRGDKDYKQVLAELNVRTSLINQGFEVAPVSIENNQELPLDLSVLVIADPIEAYKSDQLKKISNYIKQGGSAVIAGEPSKQALLNPILKEIGVQFSEGMLLQESQDYKLDLIQGKMSDTALNLGFSIKEKSVISLPNAMAITYKDTLGFNATPVVVTNPEEVWNHTEKINLETDSISFNSEKYKKEKVTVALALQRNVQGKEQKIMVLGDADFMSNKEISRSNLKKQENYTFVKEMFKWFSNGEYPIDTTRPTTTDNKILISQEKLKWVKIAFIGLVPFLVAILGVFTLIKRKRN